MKKISVLLVIVAFVFVSSATAQQLRATAEVPDILSNFGIGPSTVVSVTNSAPLYGTIVSIRTDRGQPETVIVGDIDPGETLYDVQTPGLPSYPLVLVVLYSDTPKRDRWIGVAVGELRVEKARVSWKTIELSDVRFLDGSYSSYRDNYPRPKAGGRRKVDFPIVALRSTTIAAIVNATLFDIDIRTSVSSGNKEVILPPTGIKWIVCDQSTGQSNQSIEIDILKLDNGRLASSPRHESFWPSYDYPSSRVILLDANSFQRY